MPSVVLTEKRTKYLVLILLSVVRRASRNFAILSSHDCAGLHALLYFSLRGRLGSYQGAISATHQCVSWTLLRSVCISLELRTLTMNQKTDTSPSEGYCREFEQQGGC